jgi:hypothetical protein
VTRTVTRNLLFAAGLVAVAVAMPVAASAHTFPESRNVVAQVERDHLVVVIGYQPATGGTSLAALGQAAMEPKAAKSLALRAILAARAVSPLTITIDGTAAVAASTSVKVFVDPPGSDRLAIAILQIYDLPPRAVDVAIGIADPRTAFSWVNRDGCQRETSSVWPPRSWVSGVASFLLQVAGPDAGVEPCVATELPSPSLPSAPATASSTPATTPTAKHRRSTSRRHSAARSSATSTRSSSPAR